MKIPPKPPYVLPVEMPMRYEHIPYEGEIWYDATGRMLDIEEVFSAVEWLYEHAQGKS